MKTHFKCFIITTFGLCLVFLATNAMANAPKTINYQARLTDAAGDPVADGPYLVKFIIYNSEFGGAKLWISGFQTVNTVNGLFSYQLGSNTPFPNNLFADTSLWLGVTIGTDPELLPYTQITAQAFANGAVNSDTAGIAATVVDNSITGAKIVDGTIGAADINSAEVQRRITGVAGANEAITSINPDGTVGVTSVGTGDITSVSAGSGLVGGGTNGAVTLSVGSGAITSAHLANNCVSSGNIVDGSLMATDLGDEAGLVTRNNVNFISLSVSTPTKLDSITITAPTSGFVMVYASSYVQMFHNTAGQQTVVRGWISVAPSTTTDFDSFNYLVLPPGAGTGIWYQSMSLVAFKSVSAGAHKYYLVGDLGNSTSQPASIARPHLMAQFFPTAYGTFVNTLPPAGARHEASAVNYREDGSLPTDALKER